MATTYAQQMLDLLSSATRASVLAQVAKDEETAAKRAKLDAYLRPHPLNPFTHCPCLTSCGSVCGLPFREGECRVHMSYTDSMVIIAAQEAWQESNS